MRSCDLSLLLDLSAAIATLRDRSALRRVLRDQALPGLGFRGVGLFVLTADEQHLTDWAAAPAAGRPAEAPRLLPYPDSGHAARVRSLLAAGGPLALPAAEGRPGLAALLRAGGRVLGYLCCHNPAADALPRHQRPLVQAVADQVAGAVANILAHEELVAREREKNLHLAATTALTSAADWTEKFAAVALAIGELVPWDGCRFLFPQRSGQDLTWRRGPGAGSDTGPDTGPDTAMERLSFDATLRELAVAPLTWRALFNATAPLHQRAAVYAGPAFTQLSKKYGLVRQMRAHWGSRAELYLPVGRPDAPLAVLVLASRRANGLSPAHLALLLRLAPQLALALENLFSFEQIAQQERERSRQLALNHALVTITDSSALYRAVAVELNPLLPFDSLSAWTFTADRLLHFTVVQKDGSGAFVDITAESRAAYSELETRETEALMRRELTPAVYTGEGFAAMCAAQQVYRVRRDGFQLASALELPLPVRDGLRAVLVLGSRTAFAFIPDDLRLVLPFAPQLALAVENMVAHDELNRLRLRAEQEKGYLAEEINTTHNFEAMVGASPALQGVFRQISLVAGTEATVLITGETGTGKELIARALHGQSARRAGTLIKLNCAALPASLIESELFGHEKGAFTGATERRVGKFELAQGSTIFLDEIGELPLALQSKLLRVLQEREFERLGGNQVLRADVRVLAATNRDLAAEVAAGRFRADLYYRLSVFPLHVPALRERPDDLPLLAQHFARRFSRALGKPYAGIQAAAMRELHAYAWPGNIRELENLVEQAVIVCSGPLAWARALPPATPAAAAAAKPSSEPAEVSSLKTELGGLERTRILAALRQCQGRIRGPRGAALLLGLKPTTLESRMAKLGIRKELLMVSE